MIDLKKIYSFIAQSFHKSHEYFKWGENAIVQGALEDLPAPKVVSEQFSDGDYFAVVSLGSIRSERAGNKELFQPHYSYLITLCHKGKVGDITKIRNDMINEFAAGWGEFWNGLPRYIQDIEDIATSVPNLESEIDIIAVQFAGTILHVTTKAKGGSLYG